MKVAIEKIDSTTKQNNLIAKSNNLVLDKNRIISEDLKNLTSEINYITKKNEHNTDAIVFYNTIDFSFLSKEFNNSYYIIRQSMNNEKETFIKTYGSVNYLSEIKSKILIKDGEYIFQFVNDIYTGKLTHMDNIITNKILPKTFIKQNIRGIQIGNTCDYVILLKINEKEIIYAFGKSNCK